MSTTETNERTQTPMDPVTFELIRHKLLRVTDETIIALENVSVQQIYDQSTIGTLRRRLMNIDAHCTEKETSAVGQRCPQIVRN